MLQDSKKKRRRQHEKLNRKVDVRLPQRRKFNFYCASPVHLIITMIMWIRTSRLSIQNSFCVRLQGTLSNESDGPILAIAKFTRKHPTVEFS